VAVFVQLLPLLMIGGVVGIFMSIAAVRLGKNPVLWFFLTLVPLVNMIAVPLLILGTLVNLNTRLKVLEDAQKFS
jgi:hypothetical protein